MLWGIGIGTNISLSGVMGDWDWDWGKFCFDADLWLSGMEIEGGMRLCYGGTWLFVGIIHSIS